jgi:hypothetical protein
LSKKRGAIERANLVVGMHVRMGKHRREKATRLGARRHDANRIAAACKGQGRNPRNERFRYARIINGRYRTPFFD